MLVFVGLLAPSVAFPSFPPQHMPHNKHIHTLVDIYMLVDIYSRIIYVPST